MDILIDGRKVQYIDCGSGPQVLLLHGWGAPAATYRLIIDHLSPHCRVVAPDLPGFGGSAEPPDAWDVDGYAEALTYFDSRLPELLALLREEDILMVTADHGCDPSTPSTDHSREYIPFVAAGRPVKAGSSIF